MSGPTTFVSVAPPRDPSNDACPDFGKPRYQQQVNTMMAAQVAPDGSPARAAISRDDAIAELVKTWTEGHQEDMDEWKAHMEKEREQEEDARAAEKQVTAAKAATLVEEAEKKRIKLPEFVRGQMVSTDVPEMPCRFARDKIRARQFCELWYTSQEGLAEARRIGTTTVSGVDADGGLDLGHGFSIKTTCLASKKARPDNELTYQEMTLAKAIWIRLMMIEGYELQHTTAWAMLFSALENNTRWRNVPGLGDQVIIEYIAEIRRQWFDAINRVGDMFDVSIINDDRMGRIRDRLMMEKTVQLQVKLFIDLMAPFAALTIIMYYLRRKHIL